MLIKREQRHDWYHDAMSPTYDTVSVCLSFLGRDYLRPQLRGACRFFSLFPWRIVSAISFSAQDLPPAKRAFALI